MMLSRTRHTILFVMLTGAVGCGGGHVTLDTPDDFVVLEEDDSTYDTRATSAHGVVLAVRELDNDVSGNLAFWVDAIKNRLRTRGGYALLEEGEATAATGQRGHQLRFGRDENGTSYQYWVTLFVTESHVFLVEAGGRRERFEDAIPRVEQAIAALRID